MASDFRQIARECVTRAKAELAINDPNRLRYGALELRDAMEALTYDRALAFREYIPPDEYKTWQPRKLMLVLLDIDPSIGTTSTISFGLQEERGKPAPLENMKVLGTDVVLTLADLKTHYDAIRSFLHMPSLNQLQSGEVPQPTRLRDHCEAVVRLIEKVLGSQLWNTFSGVIVTLDECMNEDCKKPIRKRMPLGKDNLAAQCFECKAEYTITSEPDSHALWTPKMIDAACPTPGCPGKVALWAHQVAPGTHWHCPDCGTHTGLR